MLYDIYDIMSHLLSTHSLTGSCTHTLAILSNVAVNMRLQVALGYSIFTSFGCIPRRGIAEEYDGPVFNFFRNLHTDVKGYFLVVFLM